MRLTFRRGLRRLSLATLMLTAGCITPYNTQLPSFRFKNPFAETQSYQLHDPYPDTSIGPDTQTRPRAFDVERREPRRKREQNFILESRPDLGEPQPVPPPAHPLGPPTGQRYPGVVEQ